MKWHSLLDRYSKVGVLSNLYLSPKPNHTLSVVLVWCCIYVCDVVSVSAYRENCVCNLLPGCVRGTTPMGISYDCIIKS